MHHAVLGLMVHDLNCFINKFITYSWDANHVKHMLEKL